MIRRALERNAYSQAGVLRGYAQGQFVGSYYAVFNVEYRMPLLDVDRGIGFAPFFMRSVVLIGLTDWGYAWCGRLRRKSFVGSVGASLIFAP
ncbi:MAG: hypothetical protein B7733_03085 [Myxococcales bacterium FL481]|nr:MAG: hypothetical protein B7733_03085 [Myxococcales bacterium FL481]